jgi:hypothetical protein
MRLPHKSKAAANVVVDDPHLPQRPIARQRLRHHGVGHHPDVGRGRAQHVAFDREIRIVRPHRIMDS